MSIVLQRVSALGVNSGDTLTLPGCVAGSRVCFAVLHSYLSPVVSAAITNTTGLTKHVTDEHDAGYGIMHVWSAQVVANGDCVITPTFSLGILRICFGAEVSGLNNTTPFGGVNSLHNASSADISSGPLTPTVDGSYVMFLGHNQAGAASTPPSGFTEHVDGGGWCASDFVQTTAATITPTATVSGAVITEGFGVFFNAASAVGDTAVVATHPSNSWTGAVIHPAVVVHLTTDGVTIDTGATDTVTAAIASGSGTLSGTLSVAAVAGIATFSNLIVTGAGVHALTFTATGYDAGVSNTFQVATSAGGGGGGSRVNGGLVHSYSRR